MSAGPAGGLLLVLLVIMMLVFWVWLLLLLLWWCWLLLLLMVVLEWLDAPMTVAAASACLVHRRSRPIAASAGAAGAWLP